MNAQSAGIGGGHFFLIYLKEQNKMFAIDAREQAPLSSNEFMFSNRSSLIGGLASGKINIFSNLKLFEYFKFYLN
jgi:gamma-glutamyltranspeptidase